MNGSGAGWNQVSGFCVGVSIFCHLLEIIIWRVAKYITLLEHGSGGRLGSTSLLWDEAVVGFWEYLFIWYLMGLAEKHGFIHANLIPSFNEINSC